MKIVIIGGGIAGLSAGIFAQKNGFQSIIYEKNHFAGGYASGIWANETMIYPPIRRILYGKGNSFLTSVWNEVGVYEDVLENDESFTTVSHFGTSVTLDKDLKRLESELYRLSPDDRKGISLFLRGIRNCMDLEWIFSKPYETFSGKEKMAFKNLLMNRFSAVGKYKRKSGRDFSEFFSHTSLKFLFQAVAGNASILPFLFAYGQFCAGKLRTIRSAQSIASTMMETYRRLGGRLRLVQPVKEIKTQNGRAIGVQLENGAFEGADAIVLACDPHLLSAGLLAGKNLVPFYEKRDKNMLQYPIRSSLLFVYSLPFEIRTIPPRLTLAVNDLAAATRTVKAIEVFQSKDAVGNGRSLQILIEQNDLDYAYWKRLFRMQREYALQLKRLGESIQNQLCRALPELNGHTALKAAVTPVDFYQNFGGEIGAFLPYAATPEANWEFFYGRADAVDSLVLAGQWTFPFGGLTSACLSGKFAIERLLS